MPNWFDSIHKIPISYWVNYLNSFHILSISLKFVFLGIFANGHMKYDHERDAGSKGIKSKKN